MTWHCQHVVCTCVLILASLDPWGSWGWGLCPGKLFFSALVNVELLLKVSYTFLRRRCGLLGQLIFIVSNSIFGFIFVWSLTYTNITFSLSLSSFFSLSHRREWYLRGDEASFCWSRWFHGRRFRLHGHEDSDPPASAHFTSPYLHLCYICGSHKKEEWHRNWLLLDNQLPLLLLLSSRCVFFPPLCLQGHAWS